MAYTSSSQSILVESENGLINAECTNVTYSIISPEDEELLTLYADSPCSDAEPSRLTVSINFIPCTCPLGFDTTMNSTTCKCMCDPLIYPEYITGCHLANDSEPIIERYANSWIGLSIDSKTNTTVYTVALNCLFCTGQTSVNIYTREGLTSQCAQGRNGTLCTECATNYSLAL